MKLASPQDQAEFVNLQKLIIPEFVQSDVIKRYALNTDTWIISEANSNSVEHNINWDPAIGAEKCIGKKLSEPES